jgi:hypothetical protein
MTVPHVPMSRSLRYKFIELSLVTEESLERAVNEWVAQGWQLERIQFVTSEASRRPVMAFVAFVRDDEAAAEHGEDAPGETVPFEVGRAETLPAEPGRARTVPAEVAPPPVNRRPAPRPAPWDESDDVPFSD